MGPDPLDSALICTFLLRNGQGNEGDESDEEEANLCQARKASCFCRQDHQDQVWIHCVRFQKTSTGKIVSKKASAHAKKVLGAWTAAVQKARKALNIKGFAVIKKGTPLYKKAKELYGQ